MMKDLRLLAVEDSERDFDLIVREIRRAGYSVIGERVETEQDMAAALMRGPWDLIISDNALPTFDATRALRCLQSSGLKVPFIIASGMIGEERAVELMKAGADDYVSKSNFSRLIPVIERELRDSEERRERRFVEWELARLNTERERMLHQRSALLDINNALISSHDRASLCRAIFESLSAEFNCLIVWLTLRNLESGALECASAERVAGVIEAHVGAALTQLGRKTIDSRKVSSLEISEACIGMAEEQSLLDAGIRRCIVAPLATKGDPFGTIVLASNQAETPTPEDMDFFSQLCNQVALTAENLLSYEQIAELKARLERENAYLTEEIRSAHNFEEMVGQSPRFLDLIDRVRRVAPTDATVLITGETGTGKELVARALHSRSARSRKPLVKVNCAAISANLVESELFGHVKGAFTGAIDRRIGRFEFAQGGTIFLDEVGELPLEIQAKLLRVLQEHEFEPLGSNRTVQVDVRVIAATNRHLEEAVREGRFRADLYFRLNVVPIEVPPLRERREDIPDLVRHFVANSGRQFGRDIRLIPEETMQKLVTYEWPGNIRELENLLARAVVLSRGTALRLSDGILPQTVEAIPAGSAQETESAPPDSIADLGQVQRTHILKVLQEVSWVIEGPQGAALRLGLHPNTLRSRMKKLSIQRPR